MTMKLSQHWENIQATLFPLVEELGPITSKHRQLAATIDFACVEKFVQRHWGGPGRPVKYRCDLARAFLAKAVYNFSTTTALLDRLKCDPVMRRMCGWETIRAIPSESTFSRAFAEFAEMELASRVQGAFVVKYHAERLIGHISRDSTPIEAREKAAAKPPEPLKLEKKKRGRPKKEKPRPDPEPKRLEKQLSMSLPEMLADLPTQCDIGTKKNSKGYKVSWRGYKLHLDTADGDMPISAVLTSASVHDSQVALPLSKITEQRVTNLYDLMDAAYDAQIIRDHSKSKGHVPLIDFNRRSPKDTREFAPHEAVRYNERSASERVNSNLKDNFGGRFVRVRGHQKVLSHLMFGLLALTIDQTIRLLI